MKKFLNTINNTPTFVIAREISEDLHFSVVNLGCLYMIFTLGIVSIIPGASKLTTPTQEAIGRFAYSVGTKE